MGLNIKNAEVERLAVEVAQSARVSKTEAIRLGLELMKHKLDSRTKKERFDDLKNWLEKEVWPKIPLERRGKATTKAEREAILGIGEHGYCE